MPASRPWCRACRASRPARPRSLLVVGALADVVEDQFRRLFASSGIEPVRFLPPRRAGRPAAGRPEHLVPAGPAVPGRDRAGARGARRRPARGPLPARRRGHHALAARPRPMHGGVDPARFAQRRPAAGQERARTRPGAPPRSSSPASGSSSSPTRSSRCPSPASCRGELGMELVEVGTPYLHRQHLAARSSSCCRAARR